MKIKPILIATLVLVSALLAFILYQRQAVRSAQSGEVPVLADDPATIERVSIEEEPEITGKVAREVVRPTERLDAAWAELYQPRGIKIVNDRMYLLDTGNNRVVVCDLEGRFIRQIGGVGQGPGEMIRPWSFTVGWTGEVCVLTIDGPEAFGIHLFDQQGRFAQKFQLDFKPESLAVNSKRDILLSAPDEQAIIRIYSADGQLLRKFGSPQSQAEAGGNAKLLRAYNDGHLFIDKEDNLYIAFVASPLIRVYRSDGKLLRQIRVRGLEIDQLIERQSKARARPHLVSDGKKVSRAYSLHDLAVDTQGNIALALGNQYLYVYNQRGSLKRIIQVERTTTGPMTMHNLAFDYQNGLYGPNMLGGLYVLR